MRNEEDLTKCRRGGDGRAGQRGQESDVTKSATIRVSQAWDFPEVQWLRLDAREVLPMQGMQVQSLVRELRSPPAVWCILKKKKKKKTSRGSGKVC